jgi:hypothetical protein
MKYIVEATLTKNYEIEVEANSPMEAIESLDEWIADDFEDFEVGAKWDFEAK